MDTLKIKRIATITLYIIGLVLVGMIVVSWFVEYPDWLSQLLTNITLVGLGLVLLYQSYRLRKRDRKFSMIYLLIGIVLIVVAFASLAFIKILAVGGMIIFLLTRPLVKKEINKNE